MIGIVIIMIKTNSYNQYGNYAKKFMDNVFTELLLFFLKFLILFLLIAQEYNRL